MPTQTSTITGVVQAIAFPPVGTINEGLVLLDYATMAFGLSANAGSSSALYLSWPRGLRNSPYCMPKAG